MFATVPVSLRSRSSRVPLIISKPLALAKANHGVPILLAGTEPHGKLLRRKELVVEGAGGILNFLQEILQPCAIAQRPEQYQSAGFWVAGSCPIH